MAPPDDGLNQRQTKIEESILLFRDENVFCFGTPIVNKGLPHHQ